ncbi:MAG: hypothetical protein ACI9U2_001028 [Bradymonadia bacterium]|jgi:hypothetical protein
MHLRQLGLLLSLGSVAATAWLAIPMAAQAKPIAPSAFCAVYPTAPACADGPAACTTCHVQPPPRNQYGEQLSKALLPDTPRPLSDADFLAALPEALAAVADMDADGDGVSNVDELMAGTSPADDRSSPTQRECPKDAKANGYDVCAFDAAYVFKKLHLDVCGRSPTRAEADAFAKETDPSPALHAALDACLVSEWWIGKDGVLWNLANTKIRPAASIKSGPDAGDIPLADYEDDYAFWVWTQTGDRDVRDVLLGRYFVQRIDGTESAPNTTYATWDRGPFVDIDVRGFGRAQLVEYTKRAGLLTHRWFLMRNTMFTGVPRTTAAQAYRAFLGLDLSRLEGLSPVEGEPKDYDNKGVARPECARCHSTLDPLTYPFTRYEGIQGGSGDFRVPFSYNARRMSFFEEVDGERVLDTPEAGVIFGQPVRNLREWAEVAADSDAYAQAVVRDYWTLMMGESPRPEEATEFNLLWQGLKDTGYSVEQMLHALIETEAYGVP